MKLRAEITDLRKLMASEVLAGEKAVQSAVRGAGKAVQTAWRGQITGAALGQRLARTIRSETYPKHKSSMNAANMIWTRAPTIVDAHASGALIRARDSFFLAVPLAAAGAGRNGKRPTPDEWQARTGLRLQLIRRRNGPSLLVAEGRIAKSGRAVASRSKTGRGLTSVPIFLLVPQVKLRKRLDLEKPAQAALAALPAAIVRKWSQTS